MKYVSFCVNWMLRKSKLLYVNPTDAVENFVYEFPTNDFLNFSKQKNFSLNEIPYLVVLTEPVGDVLNRKQFIRISGNITIQNVGSDNHTAGDSEHCQQPVT